MLDKKELDVRMYSVLQEITIPLYHGHGDLTMKENKCVMVVNQHLVWLEDETAPHRFSRGYDCYALIERNPHIFKILEND